MSLSGTKWAVTPMSASAPMTHSSRKEYDRSKLSPSTSEVGTTSE
jgi:hypothetical protein